MNMDVMFEEILTDDPAGQVSEDELQKLTDVDDPAGGTVWACVIVGGVIAASIALCPTTACTSHCSPAELEQR